MKITNEKINVRNISLAVVLLLMCIFSITTMCYSLGSYSYTSWGEAEVYAENGFGLLSGYSYLFSILDVAIGGYLVGSVIILVAAIFGFGVLFWYLYSVFAVDAKLSLKGSSTLIITMNFVCSVTYLVEGIFFVAQCDTEGTSATMTTAAYVPLILSAVALIIFIFVSRVIKEGYKMSEAVGISKKDKCDAEEEEEEICASKSDAKDVAEEDRISDRDIKYLYKMKELFDADILSEEEFAREKAKILGQDAAEEDKKAHKRPQTQNNAKGD